ncbi:IS200/IS605 family accessory protein TnpB-related protein, partial [Candidatus Bathyarchaeota archaeon]|nr:IS200/IS605 family accessory protein TnpB-related protein [Candidatus Bathyarchaeota archaeon]
MAQIASMCLAETLECSTIVLEGLRNIRQRRKSKEINGRLNRWSFRKFQSRVEYKAKLVGLNVVYVKAKGTLSLCPSGYRLMKCSKCGLEDRDV